MSLPSASDAVLDARVVREVSAQVRERLRADRIDPALDGEKAQRLVRVHVRGYNDRALARGHAPIRDEEACVRHVMAVIAGYGPLQAYLDDPGVEEIWLNAPDRIFIARDGVSQRVPLALTDSAVRDLVERMLQTTGRRVDLSQPFVDASLPDGSRLHVVIPDITRRHWSVNIRKFLPGYRALSDLVEGGAVAPAGARFLQAALRDGRSVLVSGATHAGKTTLLRALAGSCPPRTRIVTVEETFELDVQAVDVVAMQGRQASLEGGGEVTLRRLVKEALRMRPDRLIVGEVRDAEALDLLLALNTGVPGGATIHASSAREALVKLASLPLLAGRNIDAGFVLPAVARSVHLVVHCVRAADGSRHIAEIIRPTGQVVDGVICAQTVYTHEEGMVAADMQTAGVQTADAERLRQAAGYRRSRA